MDKELKLGTKDKSDIPDHSKKERKQDRESSNSMEVIIKVNLLMVNLMEKENTTLLILVKSMKVIFQITICMDKELWYGLTNPDTMESLEMARWRVTE